MTRPLVALLTLSLLSLACGVSAIPQQPVASSEAYTASPQRILTPEPIIRPSVPLVEITGTVYLRDYSGVVRGSLEAGDRVAAWCGWDRCWLQDGSELTVYRACTSERVEGSKCLSR